MCKELLNVAFVSTLIACHVQGLRKNLTADLVGSMFSQYNEDAEILQTGVLIRLEDDTFYFNDSSLGMDCTKGYIRPVVLNRVKTERVAHSKAVAYETEVIMRNLTIFYKDCRVSESSPEFQDAEELTPCYFSVDIEFLIGWIILATQRLNSGANSDQFKNASSCRYYLDLKIDEHPIGVGMMKLFFLPTATLHSFPLVFEEIWTRKIRDAVKRMSLIFFEVIPCKESINTDV